MSRIGSNGEGNFYMILTLGALEIMVEEKRTRCLSDFKRKTTLTKAFSNILLTNIFY